MTVQPDRATCWRSRRPKAVPIALLLLFAILLLAAARAAGPPVPSTDPIRGIRDVPVTTWALVDATIVAAPGRVIERGTLVVQDGVIVAVGAEVKPPQGARIVRLSGKWIYPGLIDAYGEAAAAAPSGGAPYWNSQVTPQTVMAAYYKPDAASNKALRSQGVAVRLIAPSGRILKGTSTLVTTADVDAKSAILKTRVAQHVRLTPERGSDRSAYPTSPMGAVALFRQAMVDADWYGRAQKAYGANRRLPRPEHNDALDALGRDRARGLPLVIDAPDERYFLRADRLGREFSARVIVRGSGREYRRLAETAATGRAVIVPLDFPKAPDVGTPESASLVSLERLMHWDIAPENAGRLAAAGVPIALTSHGLADKSKFLGAVRKAVRRGLSPDDALRALTTTPAELFGMASRLGTLEIGKAANLLVADGELFAAKTKILETWVDGNRYEIDPPPIVDVRGKWTLDVPGRKPLTVTLSGKPTKLEGVIRGNEGNEKESKIDRAGMQRYQVAFSAAGDVFGVDGVVRISMVLSLEADGTTTWLGLCVLPDGTELHTSGRRISAKSTNSPNRASLRPPTPGTGEKDKGEKDKGEDKDEKAENEKAPSSDAAAGGAAEGAGKPKPDEVPVKALYPVNYPLGAFGRSEPPAQPKALLWTGATVWTCGPRGILENASVLIRSGKIVEVGTDIAAPEDALVVDARGKHITPGIIDCHSHIATDGAINETGQAVTAEVRIGDFIDSIDVNIYRQLAGGVTTSNILHGSANPIGGQNQVVKLRWGATGEAMKFRRAPPGIKFALGENVKQSNWGDRYTTRYPQSRMGVEQIMRDRFDAAIEYDRRWNDWRRDADGLPPRVDLELQALAEVLAGRRWIHCHSYRQDEILALMRTCQKYNIRIGTLQHILEGYKVADTMVEQQVMGSSFSDWWAYKFEVFDAIPYNGALMHNAGVVVSFNSDDAELARRLNLEAAKAVKYGKVPPADALKFVTLNAAKQLRIDRYTGSIEPGKDADLVVWSGPPMSVYTRCEQTWVDGRTYFDRAVDQVQRKQTRAMRAALIARILSTGAEMLKPGERDRSEPTLWPREDIYCGRHEHGHEHGHGQGE